MTTTKSANQVTRTFLVSYEFEQDRHQKIGFVQVQGRNWSFSDDYNVPDNVARSIGETIRRWDEDASQVLLTVDGSNYRVIIVPDSSFPEIKQDSDN